MKPCSRNRKLIAWLALDALEARKAAALRAHLATCDGCRRYGEEISNVTERLAAAAPESNLEPSPFFHRRLAEKLQAVESASVSAYLAPWLRGMRLNWRVALPAIAVLVLALLAVVAPRHPPTVSPPAPPTMQVVSPSNPESDLAPTIANYQRVANQSPEKLSELLTKQGNKRLPPAPVYTISGLEPANVSF
jgi:anti-sigma factor RsiW